MEINVKQPQKRLSVRYGNIKRELSFNEWAEKFNVSRSYVEPLQLRRNSHNEFKSQIDRDTIFDSLKNLFLLRF